MVFLTTPISIHEVECVCLCVCVSLCVCVYLRLYEIAARQGHVGAARSLGVLRYKLATAAVAPIEVCGCIYAYMGRGGEIIISHFRRGLDLSSGCSRVCV